jgi:hypothetical protein
MTVLGPTNRPTLKELTAGAAGDTCTEMSMMLLRASGGVTAMGLLWVVLSGEVGLLSQRDVMPLHGDVGC